VSALNENAGLYLTAYKQSNTMYKSNSLSQQANTQSNVYTRLSEIGDFENQWVYSEVVSHTL